MERGGGRGSADVPGSSRREYRPQPADRRPEPPLDPDSWRQCAWAAACPRCAASTGWVGSAPRAGPGTHHGRSALYLAFVFEGLLPNVVICASSGENLEIVLLIYTISDLEKILPS